MTQKGTKPCQLISSCRAYSVAVTALVAPLYPSYLRSTRVPVYVCLCVYMCLCVYSCVCVWGRMMFHLYTDTRMYTHIIMHTHYTHWQTHVPRSTHARTCALTHTRWGGGEGGGVEREREREGERERERERERVPLVKMLTNTLIAQLGTRLGNIFYYYLQRTQEQSKPFMNSIK